MSNYPRSMAYTWWHLMAQLPTVVGYFPYALRIFKTTPISLRSEKDTKARSSATCIRAARQVSCNSMLLGVDLHGTVGSMASSSYLTIRLISRMPIGALATVQHPLF